MNTRTGLKKFFIKFAYVVAALVTLAALLIAVENLRGRRTWAACKAELEAKGEKLDPQALTRPPVPDAENFAATPLLQPYREWMRNPDGAHDSNAVAKANSVFSGLGTALNAQEAPTGWRLAKFRDLAAMQRAMRGKTNLLAQSPETPALKELQARPLGPPEEDLLFILNRNHEQAEEIRAASRRPHARFDVRYTDAPNVLLPQLALMKGLALGFSTKALAELRAGRAGAAFEDTLVCLRLGHALQEEPLLITTLVELAVLELSIQPVWEGLSRHEWTDAQLATFVTELGRFNVVADTAASLRAERVYSLATLDGWERDRTALRAIGPPDDNEGGSSAGSPAGARWIPAGWFDVNKAAIARMYQDFALPALDASNRTVNLKLSRELKAQADERFPRRFSLKTPYQIFAMMLWPAIEKVVDKAAGSQTTLNLARLACALERYRLAEGRFPETLDALAPRFLPTIPHDAVNGAPLVYRRDAPDRFTLYSVGPNLKDDGGTVSVDKKGRVQVWDLNGDWVWRSAAAD